MNQFNKFNSFESICLSHFHWSKEENENKRKKKNEEAIIERITAYGAWIAHETANVRCFPQAPNWWRNSPIIQVILWLTFRCWFRKETQQIGKHLQKYSLFQCCWDHDHWESSNTITIDQHRWSVDRIISNKFYQVRLKMQSNWPMTWLYGLFGTHRSSNSFVLSVFNLNTAAFKRFTSIIDVISSYPKNRSRSCENDIVTMICHFIVAVLEHCVPFYCWTVK